jgi:hypothetical protein
MMGWSECIEKGSWTNRDPEMLEYLSREQEEGMGLLWKP